MRPRGHNGGREGERAGGVAGAHYSATEKIPRTRRAVRSLVSYRVTRTRTDIMEFVWCPRLIKVPLSSPTKGDLPHFAFSDSPRNLYSRYIRESILIEFKVFNYNLRRLIIYIVFFKIATLKRQCKKKKEW